MLGAAVIRSLLELGVLYAVACADGATRLWNLQLAPLQEHFANTTEAAHKLVLVFTDFLATSGKSRPGMEPVMFIGPDSRGLTSSLPTKFSQMRRPIAHAGCLTCALEAAFRASWRRRVGLHQTSPWST